MQKISDAEAKKMWAAAMTAARAATADLPGLVDRAELTTIAAGFLAAGYIGNAKGLSVRRGGQDSDQDQMLSDAYDK